MGDNENAQSEMGVAVAKEPSPCHADASPPSARNEPYSVSSTILRIATAFFLLYALLFVWYVDLEAVVPFAGVACTLLILGIGHVLMRVPWIMSGMTLALTARDEEQTGALPRLTRLDGYWAAAGLVVIVIALWMLEWHQPFFFTQDDNLSLNLPLTLQACRSLIDRGELCTLNNYVMMGLPVCSNPQSYFLYPPLYLSYLFARFLLGNEFATFEVFAILHLLLGYLALFWLARFIRIRASVAALCGITVILSGFMLILGRSWINVLLLTLYLIPVLICVSYLCRRRVGWKWAVGTGVILALPMYCGFMQSMVYHLLFAGIILALLCCIGSLPRGNARWVLPAVLFMLAFSAPQMTLSVLETQRFYHARTAEIGQGIVQGVPNLFAPYPVAKPRFPQSFTEELLYGPLVWGGGTRGAYMPEFYYSGTLFPLLGLLVIVLLVGFRWTQRTTAANIWLCCSAIALAIALGKTALVAESLHNLPLFSKFRGPFKLLGHFNLFIALGGGLLLSRLLWQTVHRRWLEPALFAVVSGLLLYHCSLPLPAFCNFADRPYPPLPPALAQHLRADATPHPQRIYSAAPFRSLEAGYALAMPHNIPSAYGVMSVFGYEPLLAESPEYSYVTAQMTSRMAEAFRAYGVRWVVKDRRNAGQFPWNADALLQQPGYAHKRLELPTVELWELREADPMAFLAETPRQPLPVRLTGSGMVVDVPASHTGKALIVNMLRQPWITAHVDGRRVAAASDEWKRVRLTLPSGARTVTIAYTPPWGIAFGVAGVLLLLAVLSGMAIQRHQRYTCSVTASIDG